MKYSVKYILGGALLMMGAALVSCSRKSEFLGQWTAETPQDITRQVPSASAATSQISINFTLNDSLGSRRGGSVMLSSVISATQPVEPGVGIDQAYEVNVAATATQAGTWRYDGDSDDDLIISLNPSSLSVDIDNNGVTFTQNLLTGAEQPMIDSLTNATANQWKVELTQAMRSEFSRFTKLDDVKVDKHGVLTLETENPETTLFFVR